MSEWYENSFIKVKTNKLLLNGRNAQRLAEKYGTPLYVYSLNLILQNYENYKSLFKNNFSDYSRC